MTATEVPMSGDTARAFGVNPSTQGAAGVSNEAQAWQNGRNANMGPQPQAGAAPNAAAGEAGAANASKFSTARNFFVGGSDGVGSAIKNVFKPIGGAAGAISRFAGKGVPLAAAGGAAVSGLQTDTSDYAQRLGLDPNADSGVLRDAAVRMAGVGGDLAGLSGASTEQYAKRYGIDNKDPSFLGDVGIRALGAAEDTARTWSGNDLLHKYTGLGFAPRNDGPIAGTASARPSAVAPTVLATAPTDIRTDAQRGGNTGPATVAPAPAPAPDDPFATRMDAIRRINGGSSPLYTNMSDAGIGGNNNLMARPAMSANDPGMRGIQGRQDAADGARANKQLYDQQVADAAATNAAGGFNTGAPVAGGLRGRLEAQLAGHPLTKQSAGIATELERADAAREGARLGFQSSMTGHDVSREGHYLTNENQRNRLRFEFKNIQREQDNKDREFGQTVGTNTRAAATAGQEAFHKSMNDLYTTTNDKGEAVTDKAAVATHTAMADAFLANQAKAAREGGRPDLAQRLEQTKYDNLGPKQHQFIEQAVRMKSLAEAQRGYSPLAGRYVNSNDPEDYTITGKKANAGGYGSDVYTLKNGAEVPTRAVDYTGGGNKYMPNFVGNSPNRNFDQLGQGKYAK